MKILRNKVVLVRMIPFWLPLEVVHILAEGFVAIWLRLKFLPLENLRLVYLGLLLIVLRETTFWNTWNKVRILLLGLGRLIIEALEIISLVGLQWLMYNFHSLVFYFLYFVIWLKIEDEIVDLRNEKHLRLARNYGVCFEYRGSDVAAAIRTQNILFQPSSQTISVKSMFAHRNLQ